MKNKLVSLSIAFLCLFATRVTAQITGNVPLCQGTSTTTLNATPSGGEWTSGNTGIATIGSSSGIVTGVSAGTAVVTYIETTYSATATVTVGAPIANYISSNRFHVVCVGSTATGVVVDGPLGGVWSSSVPAIGTIEDAGTGGGEPHYNFDGLSAGVTQIRYTHTGCYIAADVTVGLAPITGILSACIGDRNQLAVDGPTELNPYFTSSNTAVAYMQANGFYTGLSVGTASITYHYYDGCETSTVLTINATAGEITGTKTVCVGYTTTLNGTPSGGTWSSLHAAIATVNSSGVVTGVSPGTAVIRYVKAGECTSSAVVVTVNTQPGEIGGILSVCVGFTTALSCSPGGGTWASIDDGLATVSSGGVVTGVSAGTVVISYTLAGGCETKVQVTVNAVPAAITGTLTVCEGQTTDLDNATGGGTWSSSHTAVATVNSSTGVVTGVTAGTTNITYMMASGCLAHTQVTVIASVSSITGIGGVCVGATTALSSSPAGGTWSSSHTAKATVNGSGVVTGVAAGTSNITYSYGGGCYAVKQVSVNTAPVINTPDDDGSSSTCTGVSPITFNGTGLSGGTWTSSDPSVASIGSTGVATISATGTTTISYIKDAEGGCKDTHVLTVTGLPTINAIPAVCVSNSVTATGMPSGGTWITSGSDFSVVQATGVITGAVAGTQNVTYTLHQQSACKTTAEVTVNAAVATIMGTVNVLVGNYYTYTNSTGGGTWSSSNTGIATINSSTGELYGVSAGTVTISYIVSGSCYKTKQITIVSPRVGQNSGAGYQHEKVTYLIAPNPSNGFITITQQYPVDETVSVRVMNYTGMVIYDASIEFSTGKKNIDISKAAPGMYLVTILNNKGESDMQKIIISR